MSEQHTVPSKGGIALSFASLIPDMDHFMGHHGGRVLPLYRDRLATMANVTPGLLTELRLHVGVEITALDLLAYIAAVTAHPGYTERFADELKSPGVRIPLTDDAKLWERALKIGREVLWLHTYGERCIDAVANRPRGAPRMRSKRPKVLVSIPDTEENMPDRIDHDEEVATLKVGAGRIAPVSVEVWNYRVSGMRVVKHWFDYRKKDPSGNRNSELDDIVATTWTSAMTTELLDLLNVLGRCVELEPQQAKLLREIMASPQITVTDLEDAGLLPVSAAAAKAPRAIEEPDLWTTN